MRFGSAVGNGVLSPALRSVVPSASARRLAALPGFSGFCWLGSGVAVGEGVAESVAVGMADGPQAGLDLVDRLLHEPSLRLFQLTLGALKALAESDHYVDADQDWVFECLADDEFVRYSPRRDTVSSDGGTR